MAYDHLYRHLGAFCYDLEAPEELLAPWNLKSFVEKEDSFNPSFEISHATSFVDSAGLSYFLRLSHYAKRVYPVDRTRKNRSDLTVFSCRDGSSHRAELCHESRPVSTKLSAELSTSTARLLPTTTTTRAISTATALLSGTWRFDNFTEFLRRCFDNKLIPYVVTFK